MRISELSRLTNVSARSIRHYEEKGLLQAKRLENDYRTFNQSAVDRVKAIRLYLKLGLTSEEIVILFRGQIANPDDYEYCEEMLAMYEKKVSNVNDQIKAPHDLKKMLERKIDLTRSKKSTN